MTPYRWLGVGVLLLTPLAAAPPEVRVRAGFDGLGLADEAMPVRIDITALDRVVGGTVMVLMRHDSFGMPRERYLATVEVPPGGTKPYWLVVWPQPYQAEIEVAVRAGAAGSVAVKQPVRVVDSTVRLVGVVSSSGAGLRFLNDPLPELEPEMFAGPGAPHGPSVPSTEPAEPGRYLRVANLAPTDLPPYEAAYNALHALVIGGDTFVTADVDAKRAIEQWVRAGGRLVLVGGVESAGLWQESVIRQMAPVEVSGTALVSAADFDELAVRYGARLPTVRGQSYAVSRASRVLRGQTLAAAAGRPLIVEAGYGDGRVVFLAAAYDQAPLRGWAGQEAMWHEILAIETDPTRPNDRHCWGALRDAAVQMPSVGTPAGAQVAVFLLLYIVVLIPVQFPLLKRLGRRELAWISTPIIVAVFSVSAYSMGVSAKGQDVRLQAVTVVETASERQTAYHCSATAVFSPAKRRYDLRLPPLCARVAELADPRQDYYGVVENRAERGTLTILQAPGELRIAELDIDMWSMRILGTEHWGELSGALVIEVRREADRLVGTVQNRLAIPLRRAVLQAGGEVVALGDLPPGKTAPVNARWIPAPKVPAAPSPSPGRYALPPEPPAELVDLRRRLVAALRLPSASFFDTEAAATMLQKLLGYTEVGAPGPYFGWVHELPFTPYALWGWTETDGGPLELTAGRGANHELALLRVRYLPR